MASRKKAANSKGRRVAAKEGKKTQEKAGSHSSVADEDAVLEEAIMIAATEKKALEAAAAEERQDSSDARGGHHRQSENVPICSHGFKPSSRSQHVLCYEFVKTYGTEHDTAVTRNEDGFKMGITATVQKHPEAWHNQASIETIICYCLSKGTQHVCEGDHNGARLYAALARYLEEVIAVENNIQNDIYWTKVFELCGADEHTLVKYFRRRIPCSCLDEKYEEVKNVTKLGLCYNPQCPLPDRKTDRSKLMHCTRCRQANYCSIECQRAAWSYHKAFCVDWASKKKTEAAEVFLEKKVDKAAMSKALAQEWAERAEKYSTDTDER
jgi:hypothetical protein